MNLRPFWSVEVVLSAIVVAMIVWRKLVARHEDDFVHVLDGASAGQQASVAHKLDQIDKWGKALTAITFLYGVLICAIYVYQTWIQGAKFTGLE